jgi:hypothetical protein
MANYKVRTRAGDVVEVEGFIETTLENIPIQGEVWDQPKLEVKSIFFEDREYQVGVFEDLGTAYPYLGWWIRA